MRTVIYKKNSINIFSYLQVKVIIYAIILNFSLYIYLKDGT